MDTHFTKEFILIYELSIITLKGTQGHYSSRKYKIKATTHSLEWLKLK